MTEWRPAPCNKTNFVNSPLGPNRAWCFEHDRPWETCFAALRRDLEEARELVSKYYDGAIGQACVCGCENQVRAFLYRTAPKGKE